jgi:quercetin 2,3-dioxygenase
MIVHRPADARGHADPGWLRAAHTFWIANFFDPYWMGFGSLRVLNQDRIAVGGGFPSHPHAEMEIVTYVMQGALRHKDFMGNGDMIHAGDLQRMSAGTGVVHSQVNASRDEGTHLLQM